QLREQRCVDTRTPAPGTGAGVPQGRGRTPLPSGAIRERRTTDKWVGCDHEQQPERRKQRAQDGHRRRCRVGERRASIARGRRIDALGGAAVVVRLRGRPITRLRAAIAWLIAIARLIRRAAGPTLVATRGALDVTFACLLAGPAGVALLILALAASPAGLLTAPGVTPLVLAL